MNPVRALAWTLCFLVVTTALAADGDISLVRQRIIDSYIPADAASQESILREAERDRQSQRPDGSWPDIDYTDRAPSVWQPQEHLDHTLVMAKACELNRRRNSRDGEMTRAALRGIDWWIAHDLHNPNWWWNEIGVPELTGEIMILMQSDASADETAKIVEIIKRSKWEKWTGQNLVWGCINEITRGCIENSAADVSEGYARMCREVVVEPREKDGIQADFSFHQHGRQFYSGGYGLGFAQDVTRFSTFAWGTPWQMPAGATDTFNSFMLDGEQWMMHGSRFDFSGLGREITRKGKTAVSHSWTTGPVAPAGAAYTLLNAVEMMSKLRVPRQGEWKEFADRLSDDPNAPPLVGNRMFWCSDYMAHHRAGWFASIKMFSTRIQNAELVNDEGKKSHHLSDGALLLYRTGQEYTDIFPVWNWCQIPGTTAEQVEDLNKWEPGGNHVKGKTDFVGGVSDGAVGIAVMDLHRQSLRAHKTYICTEDGILCLGAAITCESDNEIVTSINQCHAADLVEKADDLAWVHHDGVGYIFPDRQNVKLTDGEQSGRWSELGTGSNVEEHQRVFNLSIAHGHRPRDATYAYFIAPGATSEHTKEFAEKFPLRLIANTPAIQMVRDLKNDLNAAVFWEARKSDGIEADHPCVVLIHHGQLSVADPTEKLDVVNLRVDGIPYRIELPKGDHAGATVTTKLKPAGLEGL